MMDSIKITIIVFLIIAVIYCVLTYLYNEDDDDYDNYI
jgi:hypothetical protein